VRFLLDTNRYSDLARPIAEVEELVAEADEAFLPFVVLAELRSGFRRGTRRVENERKLARFLQEPGFGALYADERTIDLFADLSVQLLRQGTPIPVHDIWIAALTLQHGLTLYARDKHFDHLPQLPRI